jgi:hypothetical protein
MMFPLRSSPSAASPPVKGVSEPSGTVEAKALLVAKTAATARALLIMVGFMVLFVFVFVFVFFGASCLTELDQMRDAGSCYTCER